MIKSELTLIFGETGQTVSHEPDERVDAATFKIEDLTRSNETDPDRVIASGDAIVPTWTITTSATAGPNELDPARIPSAATAGPSLGDVCSITAPDGSSQSFTVRALGADTYVEATAPLASTYPAGSIVQGLTLTATVPDSLALDEDILEQRRPLRVVWSYEVRGRVIFRPVVLAFRRHDEGLGAEVTAVVQELHTLYPDMASRLAPRTSLDDMVRLLAEKVQNDLRRRGIVPAELLAGPQGRDLIEARALQHAALHGYAPGSTSPDEVWRKETRLRYVELLEDLTIGEAGEGVIETERETDQTDEDPSTTYRGPTQRF